MSRNKNQGTRNNNGKLTPEVKIPYTKESLQAQLKAAAQELEDAIVEKNMLHIIIKYAAAKHLVKVLYEVFGIPKTREIMPEWYSAVDHMKKVMTEAFPTGYLPGADSNPNQLWDQVKAIAMTGDLDCLNKFYEEHPGADTLEVNSSRLGNRIFNMFEYAKIFAGKTGITGVIAVTADNGVYTVKDMSWSLQDTEINILCDVFNTVLLRNIDAFLTELSDRVGMVSGNDVDFITSMDKMIHTMVIYDGKNYGNIFALCNDIPMD